MQLCQCCEDFDSCQLEKRKNEISSAPCDQFTLIEGMPQNRYESVKAIINQAISTAKTAERNKTIYQLDAPLEISSADSTYPHSDAWIQFLNVDFADDSAYEEFSAEFIAPYFVRSNTNLINIREELHKVQVMLRDAFSGKASKGTYELWNTHLKQARISIYVDDKGFKVRTYFVGPMSGAMLQPLAPLSLLCVQAAEYVSKMQKPKRCPVCRDFFISRSARGPKPRSCAKSKCKTAISRNSERYLNKDV